MAGAVLVSTFSVQPWADACNPEGPGWCWRAAAQAADSATLHRLPVRRVSVSCGLLQTNVYTPWRIGPLFFVTALEFDDLAYFESLEEAEKCALSEFSSFIDALNERKNGDSG